MSVITYTVRAGWTATLASVALFVLGTLATYGHSVADDARMGRQWAVCHDLPVNWQMYVTAYGALVCGLAAVLLAGLQLRQPVRPPGSAIVSGLVFGAGVPFLVLQALTWWLYRPSPGGPVTCTG